MRPERTWRQWVAASAVLLAVLVMVKVLELAGVLR